MNQKTSSSHLRLARHIASVVLVSIMLALTPAFAAPPTLLSQTQPRPRGIIGGTPVAPGAWPWLVSIGTSFGGAYQAHFCGGALIAPTWVLTAAHCIYDEDKGQQLKPAKIKVTLGRRDLSDNESGERIAARHIYMYPTYGLEDVGDGFDGDVALIELQRPSNQPTIPLLLPEQTNILTPGLSATVAGWGVEDGNNENAAPPSIAYEVKVPLVSNETCNAFYDGDVTPDMLCAGTEEGNADSCWGDSGGPLMVADEHGTWLHAGVVSFGLGCGVPRFPGVYADTARFTNWIKAVINGSSYAAVITFAPQSADPGDAYDYTLRVYNSGKTAIRNGRLSFSLPKGVRFIEADRSGKQNYAGDIVWQVASIPAESWREFHVTVKAYKTIALPADSAHFEGALEANGGISPALQKNVMAANGYTIQTFINAPRLHLKIKGPPRKEEDKNSSVYRAYTGDHFTYRITIENSGTGDRAKVSNVEVRMKLPAGTRWVSGGKLDGDEVVWTRNTLAADESASFSVTVELEKPGLATAYRLHATADKGISIEGSSFVVTLVDDPVDLYDPTQL